MSKENKDIKMLVLPECEIWLTNLKTVASGYLCPPQWGGEHIIFAFSGVRTLFFCSFEGKVFILSLPNLAWVFIGLVACMGLLLVKIGP